MCNCGIRNAHIPIYQGIGYMVFIHRNKHFTDAYRVHWICRQRNCMLSIYDFMGRKYDVVVVARHIVACALPWTVQRTNDEEQTPNKNELWLPCRLHLSNRQRLWENYVYRSIDKAVMRSVSAPPCRSRSRPRLFNTCSNMKRIKHRQFNRNNYYIRVSEIHSNTLASHLL